MLATKTKRVNHSSHYFPATYILKILCPELFCCYKWKNLASWSPGGKSGFPTTGYIDETGVVTIALRWVWRTALRVAPNNGWSLILAGYGPCSQGSACREKTCSKVPQLLEFCGLVNGGWILENPCPSRTLGQAKDVWFYSERAISLKKLQEFPPYLSQIARGNGDWECLLEIK